MAETLLDRPGRPDPHDPNPFDPRCQRYAKDMSDYDSFIIQPRKGRTLFDLNGNEVEDTLELRRIEYVLDEEGTYNPDTDHFLCDGCYIAAGMPSSPSGWKCP